MEGVGIHRAEVAELIREALSNSDSTYYVQSNLFDISKVVFYICNVPKATSNYYDGVFVSWLNPAKPDQLETVYNALETWVNS